MSVRKKHGSFLLTVEYYTNKISQAWCIARISSFRPCRAPAAPGPLCPKNLPAQKTCRKKRGLFFGPGTIFSQRQKRGNVSMSGAKAFRKGTRSVSKLSEKRTFSQTSVLVHLSFCSHSSPGPLSCPVSSLLAHSAFPRLSAGRLGQVCACFGKTCNFSPVHVLPQQKKGTPPTP